MRKTYVIVEVTHEKDVPNLAERIACRAYTLDGVRNADAWIQGKDFTRDSIAALEKAGFTTAEIALGCQDVVR